MLEGGYPIGIKTSEAQMAEIHLHSHRVLPMWNYTLVPAPPRTSKM